MSLVSSGWKNIVILFSCLTAMILESSADKTSTSSFLVRIFEAENVLIKISGYLSLNIVILFLNEALYLLKEFLLTSMLIISRISWS